MGVIEDVAHAVGSRISQGGLALVLIGETHGWLGQSLYLREICEREEGAPPPVDLAAERRNGDFVRALIGEGVATAVHDLSEIIRLPVLVALGAVAYLGTSSVLDRAVWTDAKKLVAALRAPASAA